MNKNTSQLHEWSTDVDDIGFEWSFIGAHELGTRYISSAPVNDEGQALWTSIASFSFIQ